MKMHKHVFLLFFVLCSMQCMAQNVDNVFGEAEDSLYTDAESEPEIRPDTVLIKSTHHISPDSIIALKRKKEFAYVPLMDSLLKQAATPKNANQINRPLSIVERFFNSAFFRFFIWLVPISLLLVILYNFLKSRGSFAAGKQNKVHEDSDDDVQNSSLDYVSLANTAANAANFRLAVKYMFLRTLQQLAGAGMINYASDKTNYNYVQEIAAEKKKEFARLVLNYEYVWYGNTVPDKLTYTKIENEFTSFFQKYNLS